jgi:curved DNA-binding protein CbpA
MENNPYKVLGLAPDVSRDDLKRRYRELLRKVHPDLNPGDPKASEKTQRIVDAYETLSDPTKRAALDQRLRQAATPPPRKAPPRSSKPKPSSKTPRRAPTTSKPRPSKSSQSGNVYSRSTVTINGQTIDVSGSGSVNVVMDGGRVNINSTVQTSSPSDVGDATMGSGSMSGQVMGDLHIQAGSTANITGQVMGDVFVGRGSKVTIAGQVMGDVHAKGSTLRLVGTLMGDLFADPGSTSILGTHMGDLL